MEKNTSLSNVTCTPVPLGDTPLGKASCSLEDISQLDTHIPPSDCQLLQGFYVVEQDLAASKEELKKISKFHDKVLVVPTKTKPLTKHNALLIIHNPKNPVKGRVNAFLALEKIESSWRKRNRRTVTYHEPTRSVYLRESLKLELLTRNLIPHKLESILNKDIQQASSVGFAQFELDFIRGAGKKTRHLIDDELITDTTVFQQKIGSKFRSLYPITGQRLIGALYTCFDLEHDCPAQAETIYKYKRDVDSTLSLKLEVTKDILSESKQLQNEFEERAKQPGVTEFAYLAFDLDLEIHKSGITVISAKMSFIQ